MCRKGNGSCTGGTGAFDINRLLICCVLRWEDIAVCNLDGQVEFGMMRKWWNRVEALALVVQGGVQLNSSIGVGR